MVLGIILTAQTVGISNSASNLNPDIETAFNFINDYQCISVSHDCEDVVITDALPPTVQYLGLSTAIDVSNNTSEFSGLMNRVSVEICNNGIDDDEDGLIDCADGDCPSCVSLDCEDGVQIISTTSETATGAGSSGTPSVANFFIPEANNRAILIAAYFEREHCQPGDDCTSTNTAGTNIGDNFASLSALNNPQITARFTGAGGTIDRVNPLFLPDGDLRFSNQQRSIVANDLNTTIYSREAFYIAIYEDEINTFYRGLLQETFQLLYLMCLHLWMKQMKL